MWFLLKGLQITLLFTKCVFSCHTESIEVRGHLVETGFPSITGDLDVRMAFPHWPWDVVFSLSYYLGTRLPSQQVSGLRMASTIAGEALSKHPFCLSVFFCARQPLYH